MGSCKSRNLLSNLVSSSTCTVSVTPRGSGASALAMTSTEVAITSYAGGGEFRLPLISVGASLKPYQ